MKDQALHAMELPGCWTREDLHEVALLCGSWANQARWPPEAVLLFLLNWAMDNRQHTFERYLPEAWHSVRAMVESWSLTMAPTPVTSAALCQVRQRLAMAPLKALYRKANECLFGRFDDLCRLDGLRVWAVDGSWINLPATRELVDEFGRPSGTEEGKLPLPQALLVCLELVNVGWIVDFELKACNDPELHAGIELTKQLTTGDLLTGDRLFFDTLWIKDLCKRGVELLLRVTSTRCKSFCDTSRSTIETLRGQGPAIDCPVWLKVDTDHKGRPRGGLVPLRYIERPPQHPGQETMRLLTSLSPNRLPAERSADKYRGRWSIETQLRFIKGQDHLPVVLSRKPATVRQEVLLRLLSHNWIRSVQAEACLRVRMEQFHSFPPSGSNAIGRWGYQGHRRRRRGCPSAQVRTSHHTRAGCPTRGR